MKTKLGFKLLSLLLVLALSGCGTFRNEAASRVAASQRAVLVYNGPSAGVVVSHVDGQNRGIGLYDQFELAPGLRTVTAFLNLPGTKSRTQTVEFTAHASAKYELLYSTKPGAIPNGGTWRIWVIDSATGQTVSRPSAFVPDDVDK